MLQTFIELLTAHLAAILFFQVNWLRGRHPHLRIYKPIARGMMIAILSYALTATFNWKLLALIWLVHTLVEAAKLHLLPNSLAFFIATQGIRLAMSFVLAAQFSATADSGWWVTGVSPPLSRLYFAALSSISGIILCVLAGGVLIAKLIAPLAEEIREFEIAGLNKGGQYIGWLERFLVLLLVLADQPNGIGFLIAAKSVLRFGEIKDASQRKVTEYIIIGTFLSFGWALMISVLVQRAIKYWLP